MKKIIFRLAALFVAALLTVGASAAVLASDEEDYYYYTLQGDLDESGTHDVKDVIKLLKVMLNNADADNTLADMNGDGKVTLVDALRVVKATLGDYEVEKVIDNNYLKESYLKNFYAESIKFSAVNATSEWTAKYTDDGVEITVNVTDDDLYYSGNMTSSDNIYFYIQPVNSIIYADKLAIRVRCTTDGSVEVKRWDGVNDKFVTETPAADANFARTFATTDDGWTVTVKIGYDYFGLEKEYSYGKVRLLPSMTDANADGYTEVLYDAVDTNMARWRMDTYFVISTNEKGGFVRDDFDKLSFKEDILDTNALADTEFWNNLATIESNADKTVIREVKVGASNFSDRTYGMEEGGLPTELIGKAYGCGPIAGSNVKVTKAGYVVLEVGNFSGYDTINSNVAAAGWTLVLKATKTPYNTATRAGTSAAPDLANWYVKYCEAGEEIDFGKWAVAYGAGETTPFAWESKAPYTILDSDAVYKWGTAPANTTLLDSDTNTYYSGADRVWNGVPSVAVTENGRVFAVWSTGGKAEGQPENYAVIGISNDNGETWTELGYINSEEVGADGKNTTVCDAQLWMDHDTNTLHCFYLVSSTLEAFEKSSAVWTFSIANVNDHYSEWEFSAHRYLFPGLLRNNLLVIDDDGVETWLAAPNDYMDERFTVVYASTDKGQTWELRGKAYIPKAYNYDETILVEKEDGSIWMTVRNSSGVLLQSFSLDKGRTWTLSSATDIYNCTTRFNITRLSTGALIMIGNAASGRTMMTAYLSYDDGKTWPYSVTLYKEYTTYPDVDTITVDGVEQIHVIFDRDRYNYGRIYHGILTEEYIKTHNGDFLGGSSYFNMITTIKE
ncbi:MAG: exo-alpha-sialidase [Clostridia bacterium]|nr:exo-alpha-sialidase [Clostridia bacterium]